tara:strand:- start:213 stop:329 length:117 start_codon:yes stop_codon:yes gene_type:complete
MKLIIIFILLTGCANSNYDFNPTTAILKYIVKGKNDEL